MNSDGIISSFFPAERLHTGLALCLECPINNNSNNIYQPRLL